MITAGTKRFGVSLDLVAVGVLLSVVQLGQLGCNRKEIPAGPARFQGAGYSVPALPGYRLLTAQQIQERQGAEQAKVLLAHDGMVLKPPDPRDEVKGKWRRRLPPGSVVIVRLDERPPQNLTTQQACSETAHKSGETVEKAEIVPLPFGAACRIWLRGVKHPNRQYLQTLVYDRARAWWITCTQDVLDRTASEGCRELASGFRAE